MAGLSSLVSWNSERVLGKSRMMLSQQALGRRELVAVRREAAEGESPSLAADQPAF